MRLYETCKKKVGTAKSVVSRSETMNIKEARQAAGLSQAEMSKLFEIPKRTIENWETGTRKPPSYVEKLIIEKLEQIARA